MHFKKTDSAMEVTVVQGFLENQLCGPRLGHHTLRESTSRPKASKTWPHASPIGSTAALERCQLTLTQEWYNDLSQMRKKL